MTTAATPVTTLPCDPCELGEGPYFDASDGTAWWFDIEGRTLIEHHVDSQETRVHPLPKMASAGARIDGGRQLVAMEDGLYVRTRETGALERVVALNEGEADLRCNDGRVHASGSLWIGTMGKQAEAGAGAIYLVRGRGCEQLYGDITIPNSICFSPDGATAHFTDTAADTVWRVGIDPGSGRPRSDPEPFLTARDLPPGGSFDGSVVDRHGVLWNAAWGAGSVVGYAPDRSVVQRFDLPALQVTCPCFVGDDLGAMLVTSAWEGYDAAARAREPNAGRTFVIAGEFSGSPTFDFRLD